MTTSIAKHVVALVLIAVCAYPGAPCRADELLPGKVTIAGHGGLVRFVGHAPPYTAIALPSAGSDPLVGGGTLRIVDTRGPGGDRTMVLAAAGWQRMPRDPARPAAGYRYRGAGSADDPCTLVVVTRRQVRALCHGPGVSLTPPFGGDVAITLTLGTDELRYCALLGGVERRGSKGSTRRLQAPRPAACWEPCACGPHQPVAVAFVNGADGSPCGTLAGTAVQTPLACNGLYFGAGQGTISLPVTVPDFLQPQLFGVRTCSGTTLRVEATTPLQAHGDHRQCTSQGCFFGPPLPIPSETAPATSTCLVNVFASDASGALACDTGSGTVRVSLSATAYLTGDLLPSRCAGGANRGRGCTPGRDATDCPGGTCQPDPAPQPCPICNPETLTCNGGTRDGQPCVPGSATPSSDQHPTSHDCPVPEAARVGALDVALKLSTGAAADTAIASGTQQRVFCGFCRNPLTGAFRRTPCESNADCSAPYVACEQRSQGAFRNGTATAISLAGSPAGPLTDFAPHDATLASAFCVPPSDGTLIDGLADLPAPGALALRGTLQLLPAL